jgi:catalase
VDQRRKQRFWVKYTFKTDQGVEFFTQHEADQMCAVDTDYHTRDLWEHIRDVRSIHISKLAVLCRRSARLPRTKPTTGHALCTQRL